MWTKITNIFSGKTRDGLTHAINDAALALPALNIAAAEHFGMGSETNYAFDQADGNLRLSFAGGKKLVIPAQFIASFDPTDKRFLWAWANKSLDPKLTVLAYKIKALGETQGEKILTTAKQGLVFEDITRLVAYAGAAGGQPMVYRCIVNDYVSVFLALGEPECFNAKKLRVDSIMPEAVLGKLQRDAAMALVAGFDKDYLAADTYYHEAGEADDAFHKALDMKITAYRRDWQREEDDWEPTSAGWPSDHDDQENRHNFVVPHVSGGALGVQIKTELGRTARRVEWIKGVPKITDQIIGWGAGFLWPDPNR